MYSSTRHGNIENNHYSYDVESGTSECIFLNFETGQVTHDITYTRSRLKLRYPFTLMSQYLRLTSKEMIAREILQMMSTLRRRRQQQYLKTQKKLDKTSSIMTTTTQSPKITTGVQALSLHTVNANQSFNQSETIKTNLRAASNNHKIRQFLA